MNGDFVQMAKGKGETMGSNVSMQEHIRAAKTITMFHCEHEYVQTQLTQLHSVAL